MRLIAAGEVVGIEVLDHIIIGREGVVSLKAYGVFAPRATRRGRVRRAT